MPSRAELDDLLREVRARGWALTDEQLAGGVRSIAAPIRNGDGRVVAAMNVTVHAAEVSLEKLVTDYLPMLLETASEVSAEFALKDAAPRTVAKRA
jgi:IclR family pca regulon transcriptional regulator